MELEAAPFHRVGDCADLIERINCTKICRLGQTDRAGFTSMDLPRRDPRQCLGEAVGTDSAVITADRDQL
jgi:hypothetical protein